MVIQRRVSLVPTNVLSTTKACAKLIAYQFGFRVDSVRKCLLAIEVLDCSTQQGFSEEAVCRVHAGTDRVVLVSVLALSEPEYLGGVVATKKLEAGSFTRTSAIEGGALLEGNPNPGAPCDQYASTHPCAARRADSDVIIGPLKRSLPPPPYNSFRIRASRSSIMRCTASSPCSRIHSSS